MRRNVFINTAVLLVALLSSSCGRDEAIKPGGAEPAEAIRTLNTHLVNNDLAAFARAALPSDLHAPLDEAWQAGRTRWPLDEFPFATQYPKALADLSAEDARAGMMAGFEQLVKDSSVLDLQQGMLLMSVFMTQFIQHQDNTLFSDSERAHYSALINALGQWAYTAPLDDRERAGQALDVLIPAAREANLSNDAAFAEAGMDNALHRIAPVMAAFKQALTLYGLDIDSMLAQMQFQVTEQTGDKARVQMSYRLGKHDITALIPVEQIEGRWYVSDFVRHVREAVNLPEEPRESTDDSAEVSQ